jgi:hypothetical protein
MNIMKKLLLTILLTLFTLNLNAEEPGLDVNQNDGAQFAPAPGDAARDWLDERCSSGKRCLVEGFNDPEKEGQSTVYVAIGTGYSSMPNSSQQIHSARQSAYSKAMLNAKAEFVKALGTEITVSMQKYKYRKHNARC